MSNGSDHLDDLFADMRAEPRWPVSIDETLEDRIMQELSKTKRKRGARRALMAGVAALAILAGSVGIAAGGLEIVKGWFGKAELVSPDGESKTFNIQGDEVFDDEGNAVGQITITSEFGEQQIPKRVTRERLHREE